MSTDRREGGQGKSRAAEAANTGSPRWLLRPSQADDLPKVRRLLEEAGLPLDGVEDHFTSTFVVAEADGEVIGSVGVELYGRYGLIRSLAVVPRWRGRRVGQSLMDDRHAWAKRRGLIALFLLTLEPDYFPRFGFQPVRRDSVPPEIRASSEFSTVCPETATVMALPMDYADDELRADVRSKYATLALEVKKQVASDTAGTQASCCGPSSCGCEQNPITADLYTQDELAGVSEAARLASLGCGNPTALASLEPGDVVLDLGSGGGIDVILAARRVGPMGKAYGLDMTDEMLDIARENQRQAGVGNVEFLKGEIEAIPLPDNSVDVVISNCVINLSTDKRKTLSEAFRVLKPGGRFAVSDIVTRGPLPEHVRRDAELWAGCIAGSLEEEEYLELLCEVGFEEIAIEPTRIHNQMDFDTAQSDEAKADREPSNQMEARIMSAFVRARKPLR